VLGAKKPTRYSLYTMPNGRRATRLPRATLRLEALT
jgi:hypothetical protein